MRLLGEDTRELGRMVNNSSSSIYIWRNYGMWTAGKSVKS